VDCVFSVKRRCQRSRSTPGGRADKTRTFSPKHASYFIQIGKVNQGFFPISSAINNSHKPRICTHTELYAKMFVICKKKEKACRMRVSPSGTADLHDYPLAVQQLHMYICNQFLCTGKGRLLFRAHAGRKISLYPPYPSSSFRSSSIFCCSGSGIPPNGKGIFIISYLV